MEEDKLFFEISSGADHFRLTPFDYNNYNTSISWDLNWVGTLAEVKAGAFSGKCVINLMSVDFRTLRDYFKYIYDHLSAEFDFEPYESNIKLKLKGDGMGHFEMACILSESTYLGNSLNFHLFIDQTQIMPLVRQLDAIMEKLQHSSLQNK